MKKVADMDEDFFQDFLVGYKEAALWSSSDDEDVPLDSNYGLDDLSKDAERVMEQDCRAFWNINRNLIREGTIPAHVCCTKPSYAGHDFWLTRNGHGCGFWDGDWRPKETIGNVLAEAAKKFRECYLYVGDDGKIYVG